VKKTKLILIIALTLVLLAALVAAFGFVLFSADKTPDLPAWPAERETAESTFLEAEVLLWANDHPAQRLPLPTAPASTTEKPAEKKPTEIPPTPELPTLAEDTLKRLVSFAPDAPPSLIFPVPGLGVIAGYREDSDDYYRMKNNLLTKIYTKEHLDALGEVIPLGKRIVTVNYRETEDGLEHEIFYSTLTYAKNIGGEWTSGSNAHSSSLERMGAEGYFCKMYTHDVNALNPDLQGLDWDPVTIFLGSMSTADGEVDTPVGMFGHLNDIYITSGKKSMPIGIPRLGDAVMITELNYRGPIEIPVKIVNIYTMDSGTNAVVVETPNVIDLDGHNLGVMDFFGGQSGSPIVQDGKFVAAVAFSATYTFGSRDEIYNGAIWAADMVSEHLRQKDLIFVPDYSMYSAY